MTTPQGFGSDQTERLPLIPADQRTPEQQAAADAIINGPRKALFGPYIPLLHTPTLMEKFGDLGACLRFASNLPDAIRELVICVTSRATDNQFEWQTHALLALKAGVAQKTLDDVAVHRFPQEASADQRLAVEIALSILNHNGLPDDLYAEAEAAFGKAGVVEITSLIGYFVAICWVMNVARTPGPGGYPPLEP